MTNLGMLHYFLDIEVVQSETGFLFQIKKTCKKFWHVWDEKLKSCLHTD